MQKFRENYQKKVTISAQFLVLTSSKNEQILDFEFLPNRFNFFLKLQDQIIYCYETILFELVSRVHGFKNQETTKKCDNVIFL